MTNHNDEGRYDHGKYRFSPVEPHPDRLVPAAVRFAYVLTPSGKNKPENKGLDARDGIGFHRGDPYPGPHGMRAAPDPVPISLLIC